MFWKKKPTDKASWELAYWQRRKRKERNLKNDHYQQHYTVLFSLTIEDYRNKKVLDIGCGPRGSLEWADVASERYGLDPLADEYLKTGSRQAQNVLCVCTVSKRFHLPDGYFDISRGSFQLSRSRGRPRSNGGGDCTGHKAREDVSFWLSRSITRQLRPNRLPCTEIPS